VVKRGAFIIKVVRADDRRVAPDIAAAKPSLVQNGDVSDAVLLRQVIGGREAVAAGADDHGIICGLWLGRAPLRAPALVAVHSLRKKRSQGESTHPKIHQPWWPRARQVCGMTLFVA